MEPTSQIRDKIDLVAFIGEFVNLKRAGRNFKGLCPFHNESTPSFMVSPERQIWHCFGCFPPGELVKTPFGYHHIEEIDQNHWVVSGKGKIRKVTRTMKHQYKGELVSVTMRKLGGRVRLTTDHNVFTLKMAPYLRSYKNFSRRYSKYLKIRQNDEKRYQKLLHKYLPVISKPAGELQEGDLLLYPINRNITDLLILDLAPYLNRDTSLGPVPRAIPLQIPVTSELLKLLGYYIAEGSSNRAYIRFSLGNHEEELAREIVQLIEYIFGLPASIHRRIDKNGIEVTACHSKLANMFENFCGKGAENKHIPFVFQELPPQKQRILLEAIHKGDGTSFIANRSVHKHKLITTISKVLSEQIVDILLRLNYFPTRHISKEKVDKLGVNHAEAYSVFWSEEAEQKYKAIYFEADGTEYWILPITRLDKDSYEGPVYNFTVAEDHSYIATNFAVANCGKGGDVFTFLMEYEKMEFPEALRTLAERTGVELPKNRVNLQTVSKKEKLYELNKVASELYHFLLTKHKVGQKAREYLKGRGISEKVIETFHLGFAPHSETTLTEYMLKKRHYTREDILDAGLGSVYRGQLNDFFRGRIIFPLFDHRGNTVGFAGRILESSDTIKAKYINTRDTLIYHKGEMVFGLNITKDAIRKDNQVILVEGEFDVMSCFQHGIGNVVAIKGTALTEAQVSLLLRYAQKITVCFDGDKAGQEALKRSLPILERKGATTTVILIPNGKDPDESLKESEALFKKAADHDIPVYDYLLMQMIKKYDPTTVEGKQAISGEMLPLLSAIGNEIVKEHYLRKLSNQIDTSYESLLREVGRITRKDASVVEKIVSKEKRTREEILEEYLISLILQSENAAASLQEAVQTLSEVMPKTRAYQKLMHHLVSYFKEHETFDGKQFGSGLPEELGDSYSVCLLLPLPSFDTPQEQVKELKKTAKQLRDMYLRQRLKEISHQIKQKEAESSSEDEIEDLQKQYAVLASQLKK